MTVPAGTAAVSVPDFLDTHDAVFDRMHNASYGTAKGPAANESAEKKPAA